MNGMSLVTNKAAGYNFEILERYEAGISLMGSEVKSLRAGHARLDGAYATFSEGKLLLKNLYISSWQPENPSASFVFDRARTLLLKKKELSELQKKISAPGLTIIPISLYNKGRFIKVELGLARGKKKYDKRESIKKKDMKRDVERALKNRGI